MAVAVFAVRASITPEQEEAFNRWYNEEHVPQLLQYPGVASARRYRVLSGDEPWNYMAVYEFQDEETLRRFLSSEHLQELIAEYDAHFPAAVSKRVRATYAQVWP